MRATRVLGILLAGVAVPAAAAEMAPEHDPLVQGVVLSVPEMADVRVSEGRTYAGGGGRQRRFDLYTPPSRHGRSPRGVAAGIAQSEGGKLPVLVFVNGVGDAPDALPLRRWGQYTSWPRLAAAHGWAAVTAEAGADTIGDDLAGLVAHLAAHGSELGLDGKRIALWACSANVRPALAYLMSERAEPGVRAAALLYGAGDVNRWRADLPVLLVRAGRDNPAFNRAIDGLAAAAATANMPWTTRNVPGGHHAFDVLDDTPESRRAIRAILAWLDAQLAPGDPGDVPDSPGRDALAAWFARDWTVAEAAYGRWLATHPGDAVAMGRLGRAQLALGRTADALPVLQRAVGAGDPDPGTRGALGTAYAMAGRYADALPHLRGAVDAEPRDPLLRYNLACTYARLGRTEEALAALEAAADSGLGNPDAVGNDPDLATLRELPRFQAVVARLPRPPAPAGAAR